MVCFFQNRICMPFVCLVRSSFLPIKTVTGQIFASGTLVVFCSCLPPFTFTCNSFHFNYSVASYGGERYEKRDLQIRVRQRFAELQSIDENHGRVPWHVVDASQSIDEVKEKLVSIVNEILEKLGREPAPLSRMWGEGEYELPTPKTIDKGK